MRPALRNRFTIIAAATALTITGCSGDDSASDNEADDTSDVSDGEDSPIEAPEGMTVEDGIIVEEVQEGDDLATVLFIRLFGFADNVPEEFRACLSDELAPRFPDGNVPEDIQLTDELVDAIDAAAESCDIVL